VAAPIRSPDLAELETLVVCAAEGSLVAAAAQLGISRPAVAKRIANLEALAGRPLLLRGGRGVRLTDAGAELLAGARRLLAERDVLLGTLTEMRGDGPHRIAGVREMIGGPNAIAQAGLRPEARVAETERVLELVLQSSATGMVISDPESGAVYEVNEAFCRFTGRERQELMGRSPRHLGIWEGFTGREQVLAEVERAGTSERFTLQARHRDGRVRVGRSLVVRVELAGATRLLTVIDDITEEHRLDAERAAGISAHRAVIAHASRLLAGAEVVASLREVLPALRASGGFATAVLTDATAVVATDGDPPPAQLDRMLARRTPIRGIDGVSRIGGHTGLEARLGGTSLVLVSGEPLEPWVEALFTGVLADLVAVSAAR
jgi:PAS domain S-box-containing protein